MEINIAIIIPTQNNIEYLFTLKNANKADIYVIDQNNADKFNKGLLCNIGYLIAKKYKKYDRYIFHDNNLQPDQSTFNLYFENINNDVEFTNNLKVVGFTNITFERINGFPNNFFGINGEDKAMYNRLLQNKIKINKLTTTSYELLKDKDKAINTKKDKNISDDLKFWRNNGVKQVLNFFINIKEYLTLNEFINTYYTDTNNFIDSSDIQSYLDNINENKTNIKFYKINYLSVHYNNFDKFMDKNFVKNYVKEKLQKLNYIQNKKNPVYMSVIEPLIKWDEIKKNIIDTYTEPNKFIPSNINPIIKKLTEKYFSKYKNNLKKENLFETIKHIFDTYNEVLYFRIRDNKITCSYHLYNPLNKVDFIKDLKYISNNKEKNIDDSLLEIISKSATIYNTLKKPHYIQANNCLLNFESYNHYEGNPTSYVKEFKEMLEYTIKKIVNVPDCDILINRKDFAYLRKDNKYSYNHLTDDEHDPINFWFVGSQSVKEINLDIPVPSADEWSSIDNIKDLVDWSKKIPIAVFRGSSTGCGNTIENNPRLKLADISYEWNHSGDKSKKDLLDVSISKLVSRIKVYNKFIGLMDKNKYKYLQGSFLTSQEQLKYKYIFNIQGNAQAYRFPNEFKKNSVVLNVESEYKMWFEPLLEDKVNFVNIKSDYTNLYDTIIYLKNNDDKAKKIANKGCDFAQEYITKDSIAMYWYCYMIESNNRLL